MKLKDIAKVIRSKNAGPFEITLDIMFESKEIYEKVKKTGVLNKELFVKLYNKKPENVIFFEYDPGYAMKGTIARNLSSGEPGDSDVYGAQQHVPLFDIEIPV